MIKLKFKDIKKRKLVKNYEHLKFVLKLIDTNIHFDFLMQCNLTHFKYRNTPKDSSSVRLSKRCVLSNNKTLLNKHFKLSRSVFLKFARFNSIYGLKKFYW